ncbi:Hypothetical predicted protein [Paramuricea clavata]|uniref:Uncharacterized protein n=1 Tax=Paramuricea clavata TaxID=317549 RepID=A0A7D9IH46_PARCT|nr:Hypothetical predicted protein [Paramuricea clavata]
MKSCEVLLLVFVAFFMINASAAEKECPERAIAIETEEGRLCICTKGYFGDTCQLNVSSLEKNEKTLNQSEGNCRFWHQCLAVRWFNLMRSFKAFFKDFEQLSFVIGVVTGVVASPILRAIVYAVVRLCILCNGKKIRKDRSELRASTESQPSSGSVVIEMEPQLQECPEASKDDGADSQPIDQPQEDKQSELPGADCASESISK